MIEWIRKAWRTAVAVMRPPLLPVRLPSPSQGRPEFDLGACTGCGDCGPVCPTAAITFAEEALPTPGRVLRVDYGACIFCRLCEPACGPRAISIASDPEVAVVDRADLEVRAWFALRPCARCGAPFETEAEAIRTRLAECARCRRSDHA